MKDNQTGRQQMLNQCVEPALCDLGFDLVRIRYAGGRLQIMAEPADGREMNVDDCARISRHLSAILDVEDPIAEPYILEVSSPGLDRPLTRIDDFTRFAGQPIKIKLKQLIDGQKRFRGRLCGCNCDGLIQIDTEDGTLFVSFDDIDSAKIDLFPPQDTVIQNG